MPGLPIVVDSKNKRSAIKLAREAIEIYLEETGSAGGSTVHAEVVSVKV